MTGAGFGPIVRRDGIQGLKHSGDNKTGYGEGDDERIEVRLSVVCVHVIRVYAIIAKGKCLWAHRIIVFWCVRACVGVCMYLCM
jgi:hypothetical protein